MADLSAKQLRFIEEYLVDLNGTQAAIRAGFDLVPCSAIDGFYVYMLTDSSNGEIFYVGKGKKYRYAAHEKEWSKLKAGNFKKLKRIGDIILNHGNIDAFFFATGLSSDDALCIERKLIQAIGRTRLTNAANGDLTSDERVSLAAKSSLARIKPFSQWAAEKKRSESDISMYHLVVKHFGLLASNYRSHSHPMVS